MMIQEFVKLTGSTPTESYYTNVIEPDYMASSLDKEAWCKQWKRGGGIQRAYGYEVAAHIATAHDLKQAEERATSYYNLYSGKDEEAADLRKYRRELEEQVARLEGERTELAAYLITMADELTAPKLAAQAVAMIGERAYLAYKIEHGLELTPYDRELLLATLNEK